MKIYAPFLSFVVAFALALFWIVFPWGLKEVIIKVLLTLAVLGMEVAKI